MTSTPHPAGAGTGDVAADAVARLRRELAVLSAGVADLQQEWDSTTELVTHLHATRTRAGRSTDAGSVLADLEALMRASSPLPERPAPAGSVAELTTAIRTARRRYEQLLRQHLAHAATTLEQL